MADQTKFRGKDAKAEPRAGFHPCAPRTAINDFYYYIM